MYYKQTNRSYSTLGFMKPLLFTIMLAFTASHLPAKTAQEIADTLPAPTLNAERTQIVLPQVEEGATVELAGTDYEQIITADGKVNRVISDVPVKVLLRVTKDGQRAYSRDLEVIVPGEPNTGNAKPRVIPDLLQWQGGQGFWQPGREIKVKWGDRARAEIFRAELESVAGLPVRLVDSESTEQADIVLGVEEGRMAHPQWGPEGYRIDVTPEGISADGNLFWASRTILQALRSGNGSIPCGTAVDFPRYSVRGMLLDIARTHYTLPELREVIDTMAWFKMNDLHLVINNNFVFHETYVDAGRDPFKESYSSFRLESYIHGQDGTPLTSGDVSYTKDEFRALIDYARQRGVNIVPELDTPGHALALTRMRPDLIYKGPMKNHEKRRCEMLDAANPETLTFVEQCMDEYLLKDEKLGRPVFDGCVVHVGADEFFGDAEDYRKYTDGLLRYVLGRGYTPRVWGSLTRKKGETPVVSQGVQMNLWNTNWMSAWEALELGFNVINSNDVYLYYVPFASYYNMDENLAWIYNHWQPNMMYREQIPAAHPQLLGAAFAVWNDATDLRHNGYGMYDIWPMIDDSLNSLSQKIWGSSQLPDSYDQHCELAKSIGAAPLTNPMHVWPRPRKVDLRPLALPQQVGLPALGPSYKLTVELELTEAPQGEEQVLLSSPEGEFIAVTRDGRIGLRRADTMEFTYDARLPIGKRVKLELIGTPGETKLILDGVPVEKMQLDNYKSAEEGFQPRTKDLCCSFILPLQTLGRNFHGKIYSVSVEPM